ncbi:unnamed protein product, partial [Rotaria magnacalcarata]
MHIEGLKEAISVLGHDRDGVLGKLFQVVPIMEITSGFDFNPVLPPPLCTLFEYSSKPEYVIHQMNQ